MDISQMNAAMGPAQPPPQPANTMTPDQMQQIMKTGSLNPTQSYQALGHSNNFMSKMIGGIANETLKFGQSAVHLPGDLINEVQGKPVDTTTLPNFTGEGQQTLQAEFQSKTLPAVESGQQSPLGATANTVGGVVSGAVNILTAGEAPGIVSATKKGIGLFADKTGLSTLLSRRAETQLTKDTIEALTPKLTPTEIKEAAASGKGTISKMTGAKINMTKDTGFMKIVNDVKGLVKGKSAIEDINSVRSALSTEAAALRNKVVQSGKDVMYPFKELASKISNAEEPLSLKGTPFEKQIAPLKNAVMQMAQNAGGKVSSLLDVRQEFDALVEKTWPNLYASENAPMRNAVTSVRDTINTFIKDNLPKEVGYIESLGKQTNFYRAIDNLVTKVPSEIKNATGIVGTGKEIGKKALKYGAEAVGAGLIYKEAKDFGAPLP